MKSIRWSSLAMFLLGLALLILGITREGAVILAVATVVQLICSIVTGKKTNDGMR